MVGSLQLTRPWRRRLLVVAALYFTFLGGTFVTDHNFGPRVLHHILVTAMLAVWALSRFRPERVLPATALDGPLLAFLGASALATVLAVDPRVSMEFLWRLAVHIWLFYVVAGMFARGHRREVFEALFLASSVVVLVGVFEVVSWYFGISTVVPLFRQGWPEIGGLAHPIPPRIHRLNFTLGFSTGLSAYFAALIPMGLAFALTGRDDETRRAFWLWLVGAVVMEGLSFSRGGVLSLAVSLPTFAALAFTGGADWRARLERAASQPRVRVAIVAGLLILLVIGLGWSRQQLGGHRSGDAVRLNLWSSALEVFREQPVVGVGPYGFGRALREVRNPLITGDRHLTADNRVLTTLAETGIFGALALTWLCVRFIWIGYHRWRAANGAAQLRVAGAGAGVIGFAVHNLVDTFTATPVLLPMLVFSAFLTHQSIELPAKARSRWQRRAGLVLMCALVVTSAAGWVASDLAQWRFQRSIRQAGRGEYEAALVEVGHALMTDPAMDLYAFQRAYILGQMASTDSERLNEAITAYEMALTREGTYDLHHANLSALYAQAGNGAMARAEMNTAYGILPRNVTYALWAGAYDEAEGDFVGAADLYGEALEARPDWAASSFFRKTAWRTGFVAEKVASSSDPILLEAVGADHRVLETARFAIDVNRDDIRAQITLGAMALRAGQIDEALNTFDTVLARDPDRAEAYALRAEALLSVGDHDAAERDARTAIFLNPLGEGRRGHYVLGRLAEAEGDFERAEAHYLQSGPTIVISQGWDVAVYGRKADFRYLPQLEAPGPSPEAFDGWLGLADLYEQQGRDSEANEVRRAIRGLDPYFEF